MALTYEWKLRWLKKANIENFDSVVVQTHWDCIATDEDGDTGIFGGSTTFDTSDIDGDGFIAYEELTEENVLSWIQATFVGDYKDHVDGELMKQINDKKMAVVEVPESQLPWSTAPSPNANTAPE
jgi:hypothetical protein